MSKIKVNSKVVENILGCVHNQTFQYGCTYITTALLTLLKSAVNEGAFTEEEALASLKSLGDNAQEAFNLIECSDLPFEVNQ